MGWLVGRPVSPFLLRFVMKHRIEDIAMRSEKHGFTVMEIFIVVIILGIISAIVVPKFSQASSEARLTDMVSMLQKVRSQLELYKIQHGGLLPGQKVEGGEISAVDFAGALTAEDAEGMGPYLKKMPKNPFNNSEVVTVYGKSPARSTGTGWFLNSSTGEFFANNSDFHMAY